MPTHHPNAVPSEVLDAVDAADAEARGTTLVAGTSFCVCEKSGDIEPDRGQGLFVDDTRVLSTWRLSLDGQRTEGLSVIPAEPFEATYVGRGRPRRGHDDATLVVERRRLVAAGLREDITLRNFSAEAAGVQLFLEVDADFADLFEVKDRRVGHPGPVARRATGDSLILWLDRAGDRRGVRVTAPGAEATPSGLSLRAVVPPHGEWTITVEVLPSTQDHEREPSFPVDRPVETTPVARSMHRWNSAAAAVSTGHTSLAAALARTQKDLGALRITDPQHPDDDVVAAGAPWFMALFGRDSLLTSWMAVPFAPSLAMGTLRTLARLQGQVVDAMTEEEPGKILHEVRLGMDPSQALGGASTYFGSVDATPLFVALVDRAARWGAPTEEIRALMPAVEAAMEWILHYGDRDGDGFVEYQRHTDRGLINQGWKDSFDSIAFTDGTLAAPPIALAEVQGYVYAAYRARAHLAEILGEGGAAASWRERAARLRAAFDERFWIADRGYYAIGLDRNKRPIDTMASNMGHCLWTGIVPPERAGQVADTLTAPEMFSGFGVRTLATTASTYNPVSYHNGAVWPHDTALAVAGLSRYGFADHARLVRSGLLRAARYFNGRLPELFCGFSAAEKPRPVPYPTSCSPQAWAAATPYELLRAALRMEVCVPHGVMHAAPVPASLAPVDIQGLTVGMRRVDLHADDVGVRVDGLPSGMIVRLDGNPPACDTPDVPDETGQDDG